MMIKQMEEEEILLEDVDSMDLSQKFKFEALVEIDDKLSKAKYYDVIEAKVKIFKIKVKILREESQHGVLSNSNKGFIPYSTLRSMSAEANEFLEKYEDDQELDILARFLKDSDHKCQGHLKNFSNIKNATTLERAKKVVLNFVDISAEVADIQIRIKMNEGNSILGTNQKVSDQFANSRVGMVSLGTNMKPGGPKKFTLGLESGAVGSGGTNYNLEKKNHQRETDEFTERKKLISIETSAEKTDYGLTGLDRMERMDREPMTREKKIMSHAQMQERAIQLGLAQKIIPPPRESNFDLKNQRKAGLERLRDEMQKNSNIY